MSEPIKGKRLAPNAKLRPTDLILMHIANNERGFSLEWRAAPELAGITVARVSRKYGGEVIRPDASAPTPDRAAGKDAP